MRSKIIASLIVVSFAFALSPTVSAGNTSFGKVDYSPQPFMEGNTLHITVEAISDVDIDKVMVFPCWEKPSYTCGMPSELTDTNSDGVYEVDLNNTHFTDGNVIHINLTITDSDSVEIKYSITPFTVGDTGKPNDNTQWTNEADCVTNGYYWWFDACQDHAIGSSDYQDQTGCEAAGHYWWDNKCNDEKGPPIAYPDRDRCEGVDYYWYDGSCHEKKQKVQEPGFIPGFGALLMIGAFVSIGIVVGKKRIWDR